LRRLRTLVDEYLNTSYFEDRIDAIYEQIADEAHQDHARWQAGTIEAGVARLKDHIAFRRQQLLTDPLVPESPATFATNVLVDEDAVLRAFVPNAMNDAQGWQAIEFADSPANGWLVGSGGIGYETGTGYEQYLGELFADSERRQPVSLLSEMDSSGDNIADTPSVYVRYPFTLDDPQSIDGMRLLARYDDGFVAYINGVEVTRQNIAGTPAWDRTAKSNHEATDEFETIDFSSLVRTGELELVAGKNVLAIHLMNRQTNSPDLLFQGKLVALTKAPREYSIELGQMDVDSQDASQRFVEIKNTESTAIDVSNWRLSHAQPFQAGTVIPANGSMYVVVDRKAFRDRTSGPSGHMQLFVQGGLDVLNGTETLSLLTDRGLSVAQFTLKQPLAGDFNADGELTAIDIDLMCQEVRSGTGQKQFDVDKNGGVDINDHIFLVETLFHRQIGDANLDGVFDSSDLVLIFQAAEFEDDRIGNSTWQTGDWNCDGEFTTGDLAFAWQRSRFGG
jgi:hypothetical protein